MASNSGFQALVQSPADKAIAVQANAPSNSDFSQVGGLRSNNKTFNNTPIDITTQSSNELRELLDGHGIRSLDVSIEGVANDSQIFKDILQDQVAGRLRWFQLFQEDSGVRITFKAKIVSYAENAPYDDAVGLTLEVQSSGAITIT